MKVAVECRSVLLQKALEKFLGRDISSLKQSDIVIYDYRNDDTRGFYISTEKDADLLKPFSKSQLFLALENRYKEISKERTSRMDDGVNNANFEILQKRIEMLTEEYKKNILDAIKAFYG